jgi:tight adherence protein B
MSIDTVLPWLAAALCALGGCGLACCAAPRVSAGLRAHRAWLELRLRYLQLPVPPARIVRAQAAVVLALGLVALLGSSPVPLLLIAPVALAPGHWLVRKCSQRTGLVEEQLDGWLVSLAGTLEATPALGDALASTRKQVAAPLGDELETVLREVELGTPLDRALSSMATRIGSGTVAAALTVLRIARGTGGELSRTLETAAANLREMARLEGVVRTKTAEGRAQAFVISVIPLPLVGALHAIDPAFLAPLWTETRGHALLALTGLLWVGAVAWAQRIVALEI